MFRDHGQSRKYHHEIVGWNSRMDGIQGAVLGVKLKYLNDWNNKRIINAQLYSQLLAECNQILLPKTYKHGKHIYHIFAIRVSNRGAFITALKDQNIFCGIHYPIPVHLQRAYKNLKLGNGTFKVAEKCANELVSLPMFPELVREQIEHVAVSIENVK